MVSLIKEIQIKIFFLIAKLASVGVLLLSAGEGVWYFQVSVEIFEGEIAHIFTFLKMPDL